MGEAAEMMLDGTCCQSCGEYLHDGEDGDGLPAFCAGCQPTTKKVWTANKKKIKCPVCGKLVKSTGLGDHVEMVHYAKEKTE